MELFEYVVKRVAGIGTPDNLMFVVGATKSSYMKRLRKRVPDNFFLVPGVGSQGGDLEEVAANAMNNMCGVIVNASRSIIYASNGEDFADAAARAALELQSKMKVLLEKYL
jgi:orotidine-5'-phosphate decarboxylase